jgi:hypothetical protein
MERFQFAERLDQRIELVDTDAPLDFPLRVRPVRLGGFECRHASAGDRNLAHSRIVAPDDLDESALDQRIEVARQGRPVEQLAAANALMRIGPLRASVRSSENCVTRNPAGAIRSS